MEKVNRRKYSVGKQKAGNCWVKEFVALPSVPLGAQPRLLGRWPRGSHEAAAGPARARARVVPPAKGDEAHKDVRRGYTGRVGWTPLFPRERPPARRPQQHTARSRCSMPTSLSCERELTRFFMGCPAETSAILQVLHPRDPPGSAGLRDGGPTFWGAAAASTAGRSHGSAVALSDSSKT